MEWFKVWILFLSRIYKIKNWVTLFIYKKKTETEYLVNKGFFFSIRAKHNNRIKTFKKHLVLAKLACFHP